MNRREKRRFKSSTNYAFEVKLSLKPHNQLALVGLESAVANVEVPNQLNLRRKAAKPSKAQPSRETVEPPSGTMINVKLWFAPSPHVHTYLPGRTPRLWTVAFSKVMLSDRAAPET